MADFDKENESDRKPKGVGHMDDMDGLIKKAVEKAANRQKRKIIDSIILKASHGKSTTSTDEIIATIEGMQNSPIGVESREDQMFSYIGEEMIVALKAYSDTHHGYHGGVCDSKIHARRRIVGSHGVGSTDMVNQPILDVANLQTRFVSAVPTPYYEPSVGETRVAPGFDVIVDASKRGVVVIDPKRKLVSPIWTNEQYDALAARGNHFPLDPFADNTHNFGEGNSVTDEVAHTAIEHALVLLRLSPAPSGVDVGAKIKELESCLVAIPTP